MDSEVINEAVVAAIKDSAVPRIDKEKLIEIYGAERGEVLAKKISELVREAVGMPIEWGNMNLEEGVNDIMGRFHDKHPEVSKDALHEIGRCVGWNLR
jgi:hypothetical protein